MALQFLGYELEILEETLNIVERRLERRILRDTQNPYELPEREFINVFRLSPELAMDPTNTLRPFLQRERNSGLPVDIQVLAAVYMMYAKGSYQRATGDHFDLNISQSSVSRCLHDVTDVINNRLLRTWVTFPMTNAQRNEAREEFQNAPQPFEGAVGAIDCTHISILAPKVHLRSFYQSSWKSFVECSSICPKLKILNINARHPGARNDSYIWSTSPIRCAMEYYYNQGERHTWLIGDSGYPFEPWLMTPLPHYREGTRQFKYTNKHCKARNVVGRFFGVFKSVWRCLSYRRVLMYEPAMAGKIINACAVLHNMRIHYRLPIEEANIDNRNINNNYNERNLQQDDVVMRGGPRAVAMRIQKQIMQDWFPGDIDGDNM